MGKRCDVEGCGSVVLARGWCRKHYDRWRKRGDPLVGGLRPKGECREDGCARETVGQGWCDAHYSRFVREPKRKARVHEARRDRDCAHCGNPLPVEKRASAAFCSRECKQRARIESGQHRESTLRSYYKRNYGLGLEEVQQMRAKGCSICGSGGGNGRHGQLHVDHDHGSGKVRGVLCHDCNLGIGRFKDDPELLSAAVRYLRR